jgi:hypothetical protein
VLDISVHFCYNSGTLNEKGQKMKLKINDKVTWSSAAGNLNGTIVDIILAPNAANQIVAWIDIETTRNTVRLCATDSNLKQMKVRLASANLVERTNYMTGAKFMEAADRPYFCSPSSETFWSM